MSEKVIILGGGLQGMVVGERLQSNGFDVTIVEKSNALGGMCRTKIRYTDAGNNLYDLGPHKFATRQSIAERYYFDMVYRSNKVDILSHIYLNGKWLSYPVKIFEILKAFPYHGVRCGIDFMLAHLKNDGETYESYIKSRMGSHTYDFVFKDFASKIWGGGPGFLDSELARTRVVTPTILDIISGIIFGDKTTFKSFYYPIFGMGDFLREIEEKFDHGDGKVLLNSTLKLYDGKKAIITTQDGVKEFDDPIIISTIKPRDLIIPMGLGDSANHLFYRDIHLFYYLVSSGYVKDTWDFFPSKDVVFNRVSRNFSPHMTDDGYDIVCVEVTTDEGIKVDTDKVFNDFTKMYGIKYNHVFGSWYDKLEGAYPVYHVGFGDDVSEILTEIESNGRVFCIGRHACHNYNNMDHCIVEAIDLGKDIINGSMSDLWGIRRENYNWVIVD